MNTGYFIQNGNAIMTGINENFTQAFMEIRTEFDDVRTGFRNEWVGADEVAFEDKLIDKLNLLSADTHKFAKAAVDTVRAMLMDWVTFQDMNTMDGSSSGAKEQLMSSIDEVLVQFPSQIAKQAKTFSASDQLGLKSAGSATILHSVLNTFVTAVKTKIDGIFEVVEANQAFYGEEQMLGFKSFMDAVKETMKDVQTSIKDLDYIMEGLTGEYKAMETNVNLELETAKSTVSESVDLGSTRWDV